MLRHFRPVRLASTPTARTSCTPRAFNAGINGYACFAGVAALLSLTAASAAAASLTGTYQGQSYSIDLDDTFDEVDGSWGDVRYDVDVSDTFSYVRGTVGDDRVDLSYSKTFEYMRGTAPCGAVDLSGSVTFGYVRGTACGQTVDLRVEGPDVHPTLVDMALESVLDAFPRPTRAAVGRFIIRKLGAEPPAPRYREICRIKGQAGNESVEGFVKNLGEFDLKLDGRYTLVAYDASGREIDDYASSVSTTIHPGNEQYIGWTLARGAASCALDVSAAVH